ncbi:MAG: caspase family protein, partial [Thermoplasmata archaeon]|nr:caspase family protein [Thermoplasmata archaeon]
PYANLFQRTACSSPSFYGLRAYTPFSCGGFTCYLNSEARKSNIESAIRWMDSKEDADDIVLFFFSGHGYGGTAMVTYPWNLFYVSVLDEDLDKLGSKNMVLIFDSCFSGGFQNYLAQHGRVILMSAKSNEHSWESRRLQNSVFTHFLIEGFSGSADSNHDGWVSAEEAFAYAKPLTEQEPTPDPQHPQIYDGYPGEVPITKV